jgi:outer membrane biosynthesis protein TonB
LSHEVGNLFAEAAANTKPHDDGSPLMPMVRALFRVCVFASVLVFSPFSRAIAQITSTLSPVGASAATSGTSLNAVDVGAPAVRGATTYVSGVYAVTGAGTDIGSTSDQFQFVAQAVSGDLDISARIISLTPVDEWTKAGIMVREALSGSSRYAMAEVTTGHGYGFQQRLETGGFSDFVAGGAAAGLSWVRLVRSGQIFEAFRSVDGRTWVSFARDTVPMGDTVYVGLAVTSHAPARVATAIFDTVTLAQSPVATPTPAPTPTPTPAPAPPPAPAPTPPPVAPTPTPPTANRPPTVVLTSPVNGARFGAPASILLTANATDPENRLARVDYYVSGIKIGSSAAAPFSFTWSGAGPGTYSFAAVALDADGATATSATSTIQVVVSGSFIPPTTSPTAPTSPTPTAPLAPAPAPTSPAPTPTAPPPPPPPVAPVAAPAVVVFTMSAAHATLVRTYRLDIFPNGANPNAATPIASSDLGKGTPDAAGDITVDQATFFSSLQPGNYLATVTAVAIFGSLVDGRSTPVVLLR